MADAVRHCVSKKYVVYSYMRIKNGYQKITIFVNAYT